VNVTVTGAAGRLGAFVTRALVEAGFLVRATDKCRPGDFPVSAQIAKRLGAFGTRALAKAGIAVPAAGETRRADFPVRVEIANLLDRKACCRLVEGADAVVHLGNHSSMIDHISPQQLFCENAAMNMNVFQAARDAGVKKIVFSSSVQAFSGHRGNNESSPCIPPYLPLDGDAPPNPANPYALSKQVAEVMLAYFAHHGPMDCVALRLPRMPNPYWLEHVKGGVNNPETGFAFLHIVDAAELILATLNASLPGFRIYFPASTGNTLGKSAMEVIREHYPNVPLRRPIEQIESLVDISRIQAETGWTPKYNILYDPRVMRS